MFRKLAIFAILPLMLGLTGGCAYRADLAQGNFVEQEAVNQLQYGMSAEQVRYILGTPMLVDPFDNSRWYYVHFLREGWSSPEIKNLILMFSGATLVDVAGDFKKPLGFGGGVGGSEADFSGLSANPEAAPAPAENAPVAP